MCGVVGTWVCGQEESEVCAVDAWVCGQEESEGCVTWARGFVDRKRVRGVQCSGCVGL